jgi:hypothetical protein
LNARWQVPLSVLNARLFKISAQIDFWRKELPVKTTNNMGQLARLLLALVVPVAMVYAGQKSGAQPPALTTQDYIDIQQLNAGYAVAIDECTNNGYDYAALYADDGWFSASRNGGPGTTWQGHEKLAEAARGSMKSCDEVPWRASSTCTSTTSSCRQRRAPPGGSISSPSVSTAIRTRSNTRPLTKTFT